MLYKSSMFWAELFGDWLSCLHKVIRIEIGAWPTLLSIEVESIDDCECDWLLEVMWLKTIAGGDDSKSLDDWLYPGSTQSLKLLFECFY